MQDSKLELLRNSIMDTIGVEEKVEGISFSTSCFKVRLLTVRLTTQSIKDIL